MVLPYPGRQDFHADDVSGGTHELCLGVVSDDQSHVAVEAPCLAKQEDKKDSYSSRFRSHEPQRLG